MIMDTYCWCGEQHIQYPKYKEAQAIIEPPELGDKYETFSQVLEHSRKHNEPSMDTHWWDKYRYAKMVSAYDVVTAAEQDEVYAPCVGLVFVPSWDCAILPSWECIAGMISENP